MISINNIDQIFILMMSILGIMFIFGVPLYYLLEERRLVKKGNKKDLQTLRRQVNVIKE